MLVVELGVKIFSVGFEEGESLETEVGIAGVGNVGCVLGGSLGAADSRSQSMAHPRSFRSAMLKYVSRTPEQLAQGQSFIAWQTREFRSSHDICSFGMAATRHMSHSIADALLKLV